MSHSKRKEKSRMSKKERRTFYLQTRIFMDRLDAHSKEMKAKARPWASHRSSLFILFIVCRLKRTMTSMNRVLHWHQRINLICSTFFSLLCAAAWFNIVELMHRHKNDENRIELNGGGCWTEIRFVSIFILTVMEILVRRLTIKAIVCRLSSSWQLLTQKYLCSA